MEKAGHKAREVKLKARECDVIKGRGGDAPCQSLAYLHAAQAHRGRITARFTFDFRTQRPTFTNVTDIAVHSYSVCALTGRLASENIDRPQLSQIVTRKKHQHCKTDI